MRKFFCAAGCLSLLAAATTVRGNAFQPGDLVVYRVGAGTEPIGNAATEVFLDEYTTGGAFVQSIALPTAALDTNHILTANGDSTSEGMLNRSADGRFLMLTGYDAALGTAAPSASTQITRVVGRVDALGAVDTSTTLLTAFSGNNIRSATSTDGSQIWASGSGQAGATGVFFTTLGNPAAPTNVINFATRNIGIFGGQLFAGSTSGSSATVITAVGTGTPNNAASASALSGLPAGSSNASTNQFVILDLDAAVEGPDTLYIADDTGRALTKYSLVAGSWTSNGIVGAGADDYDGVTAAVSGTTVTLYATRLKGANADELVTLTDGSGYNGAFSGTPTLLATAAANTAFRGIAFAPQVPEPASGILTAIISFAVIARRRRA